MIVEASLDVFCPTEREQGEESVQVNSVASMALFHHVFCLCSILINAVDISGLVVRNTLPS